MPSFNAILPLSTEISCHAECVNGRRDGRTIRKHSVFAVYCWRRHNKCYLNGGKLSIGRDHNSQIRTVDDSSFAADFWRVYGHYDAIGLILIFNCGFRGTDTWWSEPWAATTIAWYCCYLQIIFAVVIVSSLNVLCVIRAERNVPGLPRTNQRRWGRGRASRQHCRW